MFFVQVRAAAEAALETLSVCETCSQVGRLHLACASCQLASAPAGWLCVSARAPARLGCFQRCSAWPSVRGSSGSLPG